MVAGSGTGLGPGPGRVGPCQPGALREKLSKATSMLDLRSNGQIDNQRKSPFAALPKV